MKYRAVHSNAGIPYYHEWQSKAEAFATARHLISNGIFAWVEDDQHNRIEEE